MGKPTHQKANAAKVNANYQRILAGGIKIHAELEPLRRQQEETHKLFPGLREKLRNIQRGEINPLNVEAEDGCDYNPLWTFDDLSQNEKKASDRLERLSEKLREQNGHLDSIRTELQALLLQAIADGLPLDRDVDKESLLGIAASDVQAQAATRKRPGPHGPRKQTIIRRSQIKLLHREGISGLEACKKLNDAPIPLPSKRLNQIYDGDWVQWFRADPNGFYRQWSADLKRG